MTEEKDRIKGGVITMGSLFWGNGRNCLKNQESVRLGKERTKWRNENLIIADTKQIQLPIRYGKKATTRKNTYTMVFSRQYLNKECFGLIVPFKDEIDFYAKGMLEEQARRMATAEGIIKNGSVCLAMDWCAMAIWINPALPHNKDLSNEWLSIVNNNNCFKYKNNNPLVPRYATDYSGDNDKVLLNNNFELIDVPIKCDFDFLLLTYTRPDLSYPDTKTIADAINQKNSKYNTYLRRNIKSKILTSDDEEICDFLKPLMKFN